MTTPPLSSPGGNAAPLKISLILCCHNASPRLAPTLKHIAAQTGVTPEQWEVLLVDNASTDGTAETAEILWREYGAPAGLRIVSEPRLGVTNARRTGILAARYPIASLIDDDNWICPEWCATVLELMARHPEIAVIACASQAAFDPGQIVPEWFAALQHGYAVGAQAQKNGAIEADLPRFHTAGLSFRRDVFHDLFQKGFSTLLTGRSGQQLSAGEDAEMTLALGLCGYRSWYDDRLRFAHYMPGNRLTAAYAIKLFRGLGKASIIEDYYRAFARRRLRDNKTLRYANVMAKIFLHQARALCLPRGSARDQEEIEASYYKGRLAGMRAYGPSRQEIAAHIAGWAKPSQSQ